MNWQEYWSQRDNAGHRHSSGEWIEFYARELMLYFPDRAVHALEIGCGNGDLYGHLRRCFASYVGIDFSYSMIAQFRTRYPGTKLICANASFLPVTGFKYDLIFSRQVAQYLDEAMLRRNLEQVGRLLGPDGVYILADVPDARLRLYHYADALRGDHAPDWLGAMRQAAAVRIRGKDDGLGHWYSRQALCELAAEYGFACETFSSAGYEYRFHAALRKEKRNAGAL